MLPYSIVSITKRGSSLIRGCGLFPLGCRRRLWLFRTRIDKGNVVPIVLKKDLFLNYVAFNLLDISPKFTSEAVKRPLSWEEIWQNCVISDNLCVEIPFVNTHFSCDTNDWLWLKLQMMSHLAAKCHKFCFPFAMGSCRLKLMQQ